MKKYDLYLTGTVGGWGITADFVKYILDKKKDQPVDVAICSLGGYVDTGLQIYELFKNHGQVTCHFIGMSASAATFMAMGAKKVVMSKNALVLIHNAMGYVFEYGQYNKEQIDELLGRLQFQRSQLNTIDDVLAQIYADRCKKKIDDVKAKMKVAAWIKAADALDFGLVDEIVDAESMPTNVRNIYTNTLIKDMGLPALPKGFNVETGEENPTAGIVQKVVEMLKGLIPEPSTVSQNKMIKVFTAVMALLAIKDGFKPDEQGNVSLTQEQMKAIDDELKKQNDACAQATQAINSQKEKIDKLEKEKKELEEQVKNLNGSAGSKNEERVDGNVTSINAANELFNAIKDAL